jgi:DNA-binding NtrC family response regulator
MRDETADGSRLTAEAGQEAQPGVVVVFSGGKSVCVPLPVGDSPVVLGRTPGSAGVLLPDERLSRKHATIARKGDGSGWVVRDCGSRNGTFVDGEPLTGSITVASPRVIRLGDTILLPVPDVRAVADQGAGAGLDGAVVGSRLREALRAVEQAGATSATLVIQGESGSGKELAARTFHAAGPRAGGPFIAVNCAAVPEALAERLLFGAKRGAYSGAATDAVGYLQAADGGVLFLDEIGDLDLQVQAKLLRALETREVVPLGAASGQRVDLRVCVAIQRDLRAAVADGRFRADLYYRLAPPEVTLPPLRERLDEVPRHIQSEIGRVSKQLSPHVRLVESCMLRAWPGNVRELRKEIHYAAQGALRENVDRVRLEHLSPNAGSTLAAGRPPPAPADPGKGAERASAAPPEGAAEPPKRKYVRWGESLTREQIEQALADARGSVAVAARSLQMHRAQLYREMARWSMPVPTGEAERD